MDGIGTSAPELPIAPPPVEADGAGSQEDGASDGMIDSHQTHTGDHDGTAQQA
jgi:hypothetical protein